MANEFKEIEIRAPLNNQKDVKEFLGRNGRLVSESIFQRDTYFIPSHRNFLSPKNPSEWLRLRESQKGNSGSIIK